MSFDDKAKKPTDKTLARAMGDAKRLWDKLIDGLDAEYGPLNREWTFYKSWALRIKRKKRTILYLLPRDLLILYIYRRVDKKGALINE